MDYGKLLCKAYEINKSNIHKEVPCYKTKYSPGKDLQPLKVSPESVKEFLARKEAAERQNQIESLKRKEEILRRKQISRNAARKVRAKVRKANHAQRLFQSLISDEGTKQCDEDDYGFVSNEAAAFYDKVINNYASTTPSGPSNTEKNIKNLVATKYKNIIDKQKAQGIMVNNQKEIPSQVLPTNKNQPLIHKFDEALHLADVKQHETVFSSKKKSAFEPDVILKRKENMERFKHKMDARLSRLQIYEKQNNKNIKMLNDTSVCSERSRIYEQICKNTAKTNKSDYDFVKRPLGKKVKLQLNKDQQKDGPKMKTCSSNKLEIPTVKRSKGSCSGTTQNNFSHTKIANERMDSTGVKDSFNEKQPNIDKKLELIKLKKQLLAEKVQLKKIELLQMKYAKRKINISETNSKRQIISEDEDEEEVSTSAPKISVSENKEESTSSTPNISENKDISTYITEIFGTDDSSIYPSAEDDSVESNIAKLMGEEC